LLFGRAPPLGDGVGQSPASTTRLSSTTYDQFTCLSYLAPTPMSILPSIDATSLAD